MANALAARQRDPYQAVIAELTGLRQLERGWDSYDAESVNRDALINAIEFVNQFRSLSEPVPPPAVGVAPDGGVIMRWVTVDREVDVVYRPGYGGTFAVLRRDTRDIVREGNLGNVDPLKVVVGADVLGWKQLEQRAKR